MVDDSVEVILRTEFSAEFVQGMQSRMVVSFYKYGYVNNAYPETVNAISSLMQRLRLYAESGNTEFLMDAANFAMIEFMHPRHPKAHFEGTDDEASPGRIAAKTGRPDKRDNNEIGTNEKSITAKYR